MQTVTTCSSGVCGVRISFVRTRVRFSAFRSPVEEEENGVSADTQTPRFAEASGSTGKHLPARISLHSTPQNLCVLFW